MLEGVDLQLLLCISNITIKHELLFFIKNLYIDCNWMLVKKTHCMTDQEMACLCMCFIELTVNWHCICEHLMINIIPHSTNNIPFHSVIQVFLWMCIFFSKLLSDLSYIYLWLPLPLRPFSVQKVISTNLILVAVNSLCPCESRKVDIEPVEVQHNETTACNRLLMQHYRRRSPTCLNYHPDVSMIYHSYPCTSLKESCEIMKLPSSSHMVFIFISSSCYHIHSCYSYFLLNTWPPSEL